MGMKRSDQLTKTELYHFTYSFNWQEVGVGRVKANIIFEPSDWKIYFLYKSRKEAYWGKYNFWFSNFQSHIVLS